MYSIISPKKTNITKCFVDFETCNLNLHECQNLPWEAAYITLMDNKIADKKQFYINWGFPLQVSKDAAEKTGYNAEKVAKEGIPPEEAYDILYPQFEQADHVCGHNILRFDIYIWMAMCAKLGRKISNWVWKALDTNSIAKGIKMEQLPKKDEDFISWQYKMAHIRKRGVKTNLEFLGREFEIEHDYSTLHQALSDLELNIKVFNQLKYSFKTD